MWGYEEKVREGELLLPCERSPQLFKKARQHKSWQGPVKRPEIKVRGLLLPGAPPNRALDV